MVAAYTLGSAPCAAGMPTSSWPHDPTAVIHPLPVLPVIPDAVVPGWAPVARSRDPAAVSRRCSSARNSRLASLDAP